MLFKALRDTSEEGTSDSIDPNSKCVSRDPDLLRQFLAEIYLRLLLFLVVKQDQITVVLAQPLQAQLQTIELRILLIGYFLQFRRSGVYNSEGRGRREFLTLVFE